MEPNLTWLLLIAAAVLMIVGAIRFDWLTPPWRRPTDDAPKPPHNAAPAPPWRPAPGLHPHDAPAHKPGFHRSGRRH